MSTYLNGGVKILCGDYGQALKGLRKGAFVYLDPPYMPISSSSSFTGYTEGGFGYDEQVRLKEECDKLASKGIHFMQSNSDCPEIRALYSDYEILTVKAKRAINSRGNRRRGNQRGVDPWLTIRRMWRGASFSRSTESQRR